MAFQSLWTAASIAACAAVTAGCAQQSRPDAVAAVDEPPAEQVAVISRTEEPAVRWQPPATCPAWASDSRPEGSNCYGILPETCGADRAARYVGMEGTDQVRAALETIAVRELRWLPPRTAYTDDLSDGRLNVILDENNMITRVDCY